MSYGNLIIYTHLFVIDGTSFKHCWRNVNIALLDCYLRPNDKILSTVHFSHIKKIGQFKSWHSGYHGNQNYFVLIFDICFLYALKSQKYLITLYGHFQISTIWQFKCLHYGYCEVAITVQISSKFHLHLVVWCHIFSQFRDHRPNTIIIFNQFCFQLCYP